ncbi:MAG: hypothetical protein ACRD1A_06935 [Terriglobales bacterium]
MQTARLPRDVAFPASRPRVRNISALVAVPTPFANDGNPLDISRDGSHVK